MISNKRQFLKCITFKQFIINWWNFNRANYNIIIRTIFLFKVFIGSVIAFTCKLQSYFTIATFKDFEEKKNGMDKIFKHTTSGPINN